MFALILTLAVLDHPSGRTGVEPGVAQVGVSGEGVLTQGVIVGEASWTEGRDADLRAANLGLQWRG